MDDRYSTPLAASSLGTIGRFRAGVKLRGRRATTSGDDGEEAPRALPLLRESAAICWHFLDRTAPPTDRGIMRRGTSYLEILITMAVVGIIAAIAAPRLARA
jgi:hypothetical protein